MIKSFVQSFILTLFITSNVLACEFDEFTDGKNSQAYIHRLPFPYEILIHICGYLDIPDILNLSQTSKQFNSITNDHLIWKPIAEYFQIYIEDENPDYKSLVKRYAIPTVFKIPDNIELLSINDKGDCCGCIGTPQYSAQGLYYTKSHNGIYKIQEINEPLSYILKITNQSFISGNTLNCNKCYEAYWFDKNGKHLLPSPLNTNAYVVCVGNTTIAGMIQDTDTRKVRLIRWYRADTNEDFNYKVELPDIIDINGNVYQSSSEPQKSWVLSGNEDENLTVGCIFLHNLSFSTGFLWKNNKLYLLDKIHEYKGSEALDVSNDGNVIVGKIEDSSFNTRAVVWNKYGDHYKKNKLTHPFKKITKKSRASYVSKDGRIIAGNIECIDKDNRYYTICHVALWINQQYSEFNVPLLPDKKFFQIVSMSRNGSNFITRTDNGESYIIHQPRPDLTARYFPKKAL